MIHHSHLPPASAYLTRSALIRSFSTALPEGESTFPHRLGFVAGCRSHPDESYRAHLQTRIEEPDATRTARILERNKHPLHEDGRQGSGY